MGPSRSVLSLRRGRARVYIIVVFCSGSFAKYRQLSGSMKLKILKEKLNDLPPVDIVEILKDLDHDQRVTVIN